MFASFGLLVMYFGLKCFDLDNLCFLTFCHDFAFAVKLCTKDL